MDEYAGFLIAGGEAVGDAYGGSYASGNDTAEQIFIASVRDDVRCSLIGNQDACGSVSGAEGRLDRDFCSRAHGEDAAQTIGENSTTADSATSSFPEFDTVLKIFFAVNLTDRCMTPLPVNRDTIPSRVCYFTSRNRGLCAVDHSNPMPCRMGDQTGIQGNVTPLEDEC